jgi:fatty acid desaturase
MVTFSPEYAFHDQVWYKLLFSLLPIIQFSWFFMLNTQLNHLSPNTMEETSRDWYKHQVVTSQNFGNGWKFVHLFSGGLGYQIEHHMFPTVNSCHFPAMADIVEPICKKHGVQYNAHSGYISAAKLYYKHTVRVGKEEARGGNKGYGAKEI